MSDLDQLLQRLGKAAREETPLQMDVTDRVMDGLREHSKPLPPDPVPLAVCGIAFATALTVTITFAPAFRKLTEPWACYLPL